MRGEIRAFGLGGCGFLVAFAGCATLAVAAGGRARIDPCGVLFLFGVGGSAGLVVRLVYMMGRRDAIRSKSDAGAQTEHPLQLDIDRSPHAADWVMPAWMPVLIVVVVFVFAALFLIGLRTG